MADLRKMKEGYDNIKIPENLNERVQEAIKMGEKSNKKTVNWKVPTGIVAAAACAVVLGVNTNQTFAMAMGNLPIVGGLFEVITIRNYDVNENINTEVEFPQLAGQEMGGVAEDAKAEMSAKEIADKLNAEITASVEAYTKDANERLAEYKESFLATGGTEEQWNERAFTVKVDYEIKSQSPEVLSFVMNYTEDWMAVYGQREYFNISTVDGHELSLLELLGADYQTVIEESVRAQVKERMAADATLSYWLGAEDETTMIAGDVFTDLRFYVNEAGNVVVVFDKYAIAPGYMGAQEFEIVK